MVESERLVQERALAKTTTLYIMLDAYCGNLFAVVRGICKQTGLFKKRTRMRYSEANRYTSRLGLEPCTDQKQGLMLSVPAQFVAVAGKT